MKYIFKTRFKHLHKSIHPDSKAFPKSRAPGLQTKFHLHTLTLFCMPRGRELWQQTGSESAGNKNFARNVPLWTHFQTHNVCLSDVRHNFYPICPQYLSLESPAFRSGSCGVQALLYFILSSNITLIAALVRKKQTQKPQTKTNKQNPTPNLLNRIRRFSVPIACCWFHNRNTEWLGLEEIL